VASEPIVDGADYSLAYLDSDRQAASTAKADNSSRNTSHSRSDTDPEHLLADNSEQKVFLQASQDWDRLFVAANML